MMKLSTVFHKALSVYRERPQYTCPLVEHIAYEEAGTTPHIVREAFSKRALRFYEEIALANSGKASVGGLRYIEGPYFAPFWNKYLKEETIQQREEMLRLTLLSALRYEQYLYAREHDIPWDRNYAYKEEDSGSATKPT